MVDDSVDPAGQIPEADLLEQQTPLEEPPDGDEPSPGHAALAEPADEADRWEQQLPAAAADDEYPHDQPPSRTS